MTSLHCYFILLLILYTKYLLAYQCHECNGMIFNYSITIDNIPSPTRDDCEIVEADDGCYVRIHWNDDGKSEVYYSIDPNLPFDSVVALIERKVTTWSGEYVTRRAISYNCQGSNTTPCNTAENLKRSIISTTLPTNEQIKQFDSLIVPTTDFDGRLCHQVSNSTNCAKTDLINCQQCMGIIQYSEQVDSCAMCPAGKATTNFFDHLTTFFLNNQTRSEKISLGCRKRGACNSIENINQIKQTLVSEFDFKKFYNSTASTIDSTMIVLFMVFLTELFRLI